VENNNSWNTLTAARSKHSRAESFPKQSEPNVWGRGYILNLLWK